LSWATSYTGNVTGNLTGNADTVTTNANLTGEVTSVGNAAEIADDVVDEANLKVSNAPTNGYVLSAQSGDTGGLTWVDNTHAAGTVTSVTAGAGMTQSGTSTINPTLDVVGTADRITANANDIDIASTYVGQTSITTLGTVTTGTWGTGSVIAGTTMTLGSDGTGDVYYRNASGILTRLGNAGGGDDDKVLTLASGLPSWASAAGGSGTVTEVTVGTGLDVVNGTTTPDITLSLDELTNDTGTSSLGWTSGDFLAIVEAGGTAKRLMPPAEIGIAASDDTTTLTTGDKTTIMIPRKMRVTEVKAMLVEATSSMDFKVDLEYNATDPTGSNPVSIFPATTYLEVLSSSYSGAQTSFDDLAAGTASFYDMREDSFLVVNVNSIGDGTPKGLKIWLLGYWN
jgi:surface antigen